MTRRRPGEAPDKAPGTPAPNTSMMLLTIRFRAKAVEEFIEEYYPDVMKGGMFIRTGGRSPLLELGTRVKLRFELADGRTLFAGRGLVAWIQSRPGAEGVGIQFEELSETSSLLYQEMLAKREELSQRGRPVRAGDRSSSSDEFSEAPTLPVGPPPLFV